MPYYETCPDCGANLDPCEKCDCYKKGPVCEATQNETEDFWTKSLFDYSINHSEGQGSIMLKGRRL